MTNSKLRSSGSAGSLLAIALAAIVLLAPASATAQGVQTGIHYPTPVHLLPAFSDLGYTAGAFPQSEKAACEVLSLPMFPELTRAQCETVAAALLASQARSVEGATPSVA